MKSGKYTLNSPATDNRENPFWSDQVIQCVQHFSHQQLQFVIPRDLARTSPSPHRRNDELLSHKCNTSHKSHNLGHPILLLRGAHAHPSQHNISYVGGLGVVEVVLYSLVGKGNFLVITIQTRLLLLYNLQLGGAYRCHVITLCRLSQREHP